MLFNVNVADPATFLLVSGTLVAVGLAASLIPAFRATLVDPANTLRRE
jgi:ABC-type lipoprotein release transport system permease subunit